MSEPVTDLYWAIKDMAKELGFADFGCACAGPVTDLCRNSYLHAMGNGYFAGMQYLHNNLEKRFDPTLLVEGATSLLVFLAPYSLPDNLTPPPGISQYALGQDYHTIIKGKLFKIMERIASCTPNFVGRAFTDSAPILEREWAVRAGLGFVGKNNFLISKTCGIKNFIGVIVCNAEIPPTLEMEPQKQEETCGKCGDCCKCMEQCPTGALCTPYTINAGKCISYHTIENRKLEISLEQGEIKTLGGRIFGCDTCLDACPWNSRNLPGWEEFHMYYNDLNGKDKMWWKNLSETEFKKRFKDSPLLRGGLKNIQTALAWGKKFEENE